MKVRFYVEEGGSLGLAVTRQQAEDLLVALGLEPPPPGPPAMPFGPGWGGRMEAGLVLDRVEALRRQFLQQRIGEFTSEALGREALVRCVLALETLARSAAASGAAVQFKETEG
jgi:hypothetical protein